MVVNRAIVSVAIPADTVAQNQQSLSVAAQRLPDRSAKPNTETLVINPVKPDDQASLTVRAHNGVLRTVNSSEVVLSNEPNIAPPAMLDVQAGVKQLRLIPVETGDVEDLSVVVGSDYLNERQHYSTFPVIDSYSQEKVFEAKVTDLQDDWPVWREVGLNRTPYVYLGSNLSFDPTTGLLKLTGLTTSVVGLTGEVTANDIYEALQSLPGFSQSLSQVTSVVNQVGDITATQIATELNNLTGADRLSYTSLKDAPTSFDGLYQGASPTTVKVGGLEAGTNISGRSISELLENILVPYISPTFTSFSVSQTTPLEVGTFINGNKLFNFVLTQGANVQPNSIEILDVTGNRSLGTFANTSPITADIGTIALTAPGSYSWRARGTNTVSSTFLSALTTVSWQWRLYFGTSADSILTEAKILNLISNKLNSTKNDTYNLAAGGYKFLCWPDSLGSPTAVTGVKDTATNLSVSMADISDNPAYSNTQNGWSYALVSVTNINGVTTNYRVYRTKNILGSSINIQVS